MKSKMIGNLNGLTAFVKGLSKKMAVDVGIMGVKNNRKEGGSSNADIGFIQEFGTSKIPKRSFLRMPLLMKSEDILLSVKRAGAIKKLVAGRMDRVLSDLGVACEAAIGEAFNSSGYGDWAANAPSTIKRKGSSSPLIDTGQLRRSITSNVVAL